MNNEEMLTGNKVTNAANSTDVTFPRPLVDSCGKPVGWVSYSR